MFSSDYFSSRKNWLPGPTVTTTELFTTPGTAVQTGLDRLGVDFKVYPLAESGQINVRPLPILPKHNSTGGSTGMWTGMPLVVGAPSAANSAFDNAPSRI